MEAATPVLCVDSAPTPKASSADDLRDAWSNPLPKDLFQVESQGEELDACTYGVGCALATLLSTMYEPVSSLLNLRRAAQLCAELHICVLARRLAGMAPSAL